MRSRRKLLVIGVSVLIAALFALAAFLLVRGFLLYLQANRSLRVSKQQLEALYAHKPFPSEQNLAEEKQNLKILDDEFGRLLASLSEGQIEPVEQGPDKFVSEFWDTHKQLLAQAEKVGSNVVARDFPFGFGRLMTGVPPMPADVPRLTQQLKIVQNLCGVLFDASINELRQVGREEFESNVGTPGGEETPAPAPAPRAPRSGRRPGAEVSLNVIQANAGLIGPDELFGKWHFVFDFTAKESALIEVLDQLAKARMFVVVTRLELTGDEKAGIYSPEKAKAERERREAAQKAAAGAPKEEMRDARIVCGQDLPIGVRLDVDVYQFRKQPAKDIAK